MSCILSNRHTKKDDFFFCVCLYCSKICVSKEIGGYFLSATSTLLLKIRSFCFHITYARRCDDLCIIFTLIVLSGLGFSTVIKYQNEEMLDFFKMNVKFQQINKMCKAHSLIHFKLVTIMYTYRLNITQ